ncbi:MAG: electron transfer flavoprotein subunit beta/FixA family protein [Myxococcota bacterium]
MKILVAMKRVADYESPAQIEAGGQALAWDGPFVINPFDAIAVEEAVQIKERQQDVEVVVVAVGVAEAQQQLRSSLAMGADRAILVQATPPWDALAISALLHAVVKQEQPDMLLLGKQASDTDGHQIAEMLAERMQVGQATQASKIELSGSKARVTREADGGLQTIDVDFPCVITADLRLNEPRFAPLPAIMQAKNKPLQILEAAALGWSGQTACTCQQLQLLEKKKKGQRVADVATLLQQLKQEAKVL